MIAAALEEELETAKSLCPDSKRIPGEKVKIWQGIRKEEPICFLKTGVGPKRAASNLKEALSVTRPSHILVIGYAGAIDPNLRLGTLVAVRKALLFSLDENLPTWDHNPGSQH